MLPAMKVHGYCLMQYIIGNVDKEDLMLPYNFVEHHLVIAPHDKSTNQANNGHKNGWDLLNQGSLSIS